MLIKTRRVTGLAVCVAIALLMVTGVLGVEVGLVLGTGGILLISTSSRSVDADALDGSA